MNKLDKKLLEALSHEGRMEFLSTIMVEQLESVRHRLGVLIFFLIVVPLLFGACSGLL